MNILNNGFLLMFVSCAALWNYVKAASPGDVGFVSAGTSLYKVYFDTEVIEKLPVDDLEFPAGIDYDPVEGKIYWSEYWGNRIGRCDLNGGNLESNFIPNLLQPYGLALDVNNRWIYWVEEAFIAGSKLSRARLDGTSIEMIANIAGAIPRHVALDTVNNKIYWTDLLTPRIRRANTDGTGIETVVDSGLVSNSGITLDIQAGVLFWCDWGTDSIESYNLVTTQRTVIYQSPNDIEPYALAISGQNVYWVDGKQPGLWTVLRDGSSQSPASFAVGGENSFSGANGLKIKTLPVAVDVCDSPVLPSNGFISSGDFTVGSTILFVCAPGYILRGADEATCLASLMWSVTSPSCARECLAIQPPVNGIISPPVGPYSSGDQITFSCIAGYRLVGLSTITCMDSGSWSSTVYPTCTFIVSACSPPILPFNGIVVPSQAFYSIGQSISFQCNSGYQPSGASTTTCQSDGSWSAQAPSCTAVNCLPPSPPEFGYFQPEQTTYASGHQVNFFCNAGYDTIGQTFAVCMAGGVWSYQTPMCQELTCNSPVRAPNVYISSEQLGYQIGQPVVFECLPGYEIYGVAFAVCLPNGAWSNPSPTCHAITCLPPVHPQSGYISPALTSYAYGQRVTFTCNSGYRLVGDESVTCDNDNIWSSQTPECQEILCTAPTQPENGYLSPSLTTYAFEQQVVYRCLDGFNNVGDGSATCISVNTWSHTSPMCQDITCAAPLSPQNGDLSPALSVYMFDQQVTFSCEGGYQLFGDVVISCVSQNTWSGAIPTCQAITCDAPAQPQNGFITSALSSYAFGQQVIFQCNQGYQIVGETSANCILQNTWSNAVPTCQAITCDAPGQPQNGFISSALSSYAFGQQVTFQCNQGYQIVGEASANCILINTWSNPIPSCQAITCNAPVQPQHGYISSALSSYAFGQQVTFQCEQGYQLVGEASASCILINMWSNPTPSCQVIQCAPPAQPQNGILSPTLLSYAFQQQVMFRCDTGFTVVGIEDTLTCVGQNTWSSSPPTCQDITCNAPMWPQNGYISPTIASYFFGQRVSFRCDEGYQLLSGESTTVCINLNTWSNSAPICQEIVTCSAPILPLNVNILPDLPTYQIGEGVNFHCDSGYRLSGTSTVTCLQNGVWSALSPTCEEISCTPPSAPSNGYISPLLATYSIGGQIEFLCNNGYQVNGPNVIYCLPDSSWSVSGASCREITCAPPTHPTNGYVQPFMEVNPIQTQLQFGCDPGYQISGAATVFCNAAGSWSSPFPRCVVEPPMYCINPPIPNNGYITPSTQLYPIGTEITFVCSNGFDLEGLSTLTCTQDGSWSAVFPVCVQHVTCPMPVIPQNGNISPLTGPYEKLQQVVFRCDTGFQLRGIPAIVCQTDGTWTGNSPTCTQENCLQPNTPTNGYVVPQGAIPTGMGVTFVCNPGYEIQGSNVAVCLESLQWSASSPNCIEKTCGAPTQLVNGQVTPFLTSYSVDQTVTFTCIDGYSLIGTATATCVITDGEAVWSSPTPFCYKEDVECPSPPVPMNGNASPSQMTYLNGQRLTFDCNIGFSLQGSTEIFCTLDGTWSGDPPTCTATELTCPTLPNLQNGMMMPGGPYLVGVSVTYSCNSGYQLVGIQTIVCTNDGTWSQAVDNSPVCVELVCDAPRILQNGFTTPSRGPYTIGVRIIFDCRLGFALNGADSSVCTNMRIWSDDVPTCVMKGPMCQSPVSSESLIVLPPSELYDIGQVITFACANGYDIVGEANAVCTIQRAWSVEIPICVRSVCVIERPANSILVGYDDDTSEIPVGSVLTFDCADGYVLSGVEKITCTKERMWSDTEPKCDKDKNGADDLSLFNDPIVRIIMYAAIPSAVILLLILFIVCVVGCRRRRRRHRALSNEHLIMAYRKQNRTLPSAQGTDIYNIYGGRDNRPMGSQSPMVQNRNARAQHQQSLPRSDVSHYQESLPRSTGTRSDNNTAYQGSLARSETHQQSLPRSVGQQNSLARSSNHSNQQNSLSRSGHHVSPQNSLQRATGGLPDNLPAAESSYANMPPRGISSPRLTSRDNRNRGNNREAALQLTRV